MDIVERLRDFAARWRECTSGPAGWLEFPKHYEEAATEIERLRRQPMDAIEQLSGSFGDGELAAEVKRLRRELAEQKEAVRVLGRECDSWRDADLYGDMLGTLAGDYDEFDATGYGHREQVRDAKAACNNSAIASAAIAKGKE